MIHDNGMKGGTGLPGVLLDFLFPPHCHACGCRLHGDERHLCGACWEAVAPHQGAICRRCGSPLPDDGVCTDCAGREFAFERARILVRFNETVQHLVHQVKYKHKRSLARELGRRLGAQLNADNDYARPDVLVPVPLHKARKRTRGFNQSEQIARGMESEIGVPVHTGLVTRVKHTDTQTGFNAAERQVNVKDVFACTGTTVPENVGIVDDVLTTGATVNECARALLKGGARRVQVFTLARA